MRDFVPVRSWAGGIYLARVRVLRSAPLLTRLARSFAGEAAPKERVRADFTGEEAGRIAPVGEGFAVQAASERGRAPSSLNRRAEPQRTRNEQVGLLLVFPNCQRRCEISTSAQLGRSELD